jgi:ABC-2 type transport system permease protein
MTAAAVPANAGNPATAANGNLVRDSLHVFRRAVSEGRRQVPVAYVVPLMMTAVGLVLFGELLKRMADLPGFPVETYTDWLVAGGVLLPGMMGAGFGGISMASDIESGYFERLRLVAIKPKAQVLGRLLFEGLRIIPAAVIILLAAQLQGAHIRSGPAGFVALVLLSCIWSIAYNGLFLAVALQAGNAQGPQGLLPLFGPLSFVSSMWIPIKYMPGWAQAIAKVNPLTRVIETARNFTTNHYDGGTLLLGAVAIVGVFVFTQVLITRFMNMRLRGE